MTREEAIEVVKKNWPDSRYTSLREALETLIPELHESEDEKIRKFIQNELVCLRASEDKGSERYNELTSAIAYLEKQKDLHFEYPGLYFYDGEKLLFQGSPATEENPYDFAMSQQEKHKEQKPWKVGENVYFTPDKETPIAEQKLVEGDNETEIQRVFREGKSAGRKEVFDHPEEYGLQKPAEWDAKDKMFIKDCAGILDEAGYTRSSQRLLSMFPVTPAEWSEEDKEMIQFYLDFTHYKLGNWPNIKVIEMREKFRNWLESLPERFNLQPKQEWNEEDEEKIDDIFEIIEHCITIPYSGGTLTLSKEYKKKLQCFLKSLRPSWKPSQAQIDALAIYIKHSPDYVYNEDLQSLYEDLEKLIRQ